MTLKVKGRKAFENTKIVKLLRVLFKVMSNVLPLHTKIAYLVFVYLCL